MNPFLYISYHLLTVFGYPYHYRTYQLQYFLTGRWMNHSLNSLKYYQSQQNLSASYNCFDYKTSTPHQKIISSLKQQIMIMQLRPVIFSKTVTKQNYNLIVQAESFPTLLCSIPLKKCQNSDPILKSHFIRPYQLLYKSKYIIQKRMQTITTIKGKLLYFVKHLFNTKKLTARQLGVLKDLIIADNPDVIAAYENYVKCGTELTLGSQLIQIVHLEKDNSTDSANSRKSRVIKRNSITVTIPKKMIQKLPAQMERS